MSRFVITLAIALVSAMLLALAAPTGISSPVGSFPSLLGDPGY